MTDVKNEELEQKLQELREEKARLAEAFVSGRIPQDVYKKTVIQLEKEIGSIGAEIRHRAAKK